MSEKEWTIMIYMAGDNNLSVDMAYALEQIKEFAHTGPDSPNLFVYYDGSSPAIPTMYCDFSVPGRPQYQSSHSVEHKLYDDVPKKHNENAADKRSLLNFVNWCVNDCPVISEDGEITRGRRSKKYAFIVSGHSLGFADIGLFKDESSGKNMKMKDLYFAFQQIVSTQKQLNEDAKKRGLTGKDRERETTVLIGQKLDILGFDACVMGMLEVGYQFGYVANTMIASEGSVPSAGWTYAKILGTLTSGSAEGDNDVQVVENFVREFIRTQDSFTVGGVSVDMAAWDLRKIHSLGGAFDALSDILVRSFEDKDSRLYSQLRRIILRVHHVCQSYMFDQNVDLGDFCELLDAECADAINELGEGDDIEFYEAIRSACGAVLNELRNTVILSGFSGGEYQYSNGISVFFPWSILGYNAAKRNYESLWFSRDAKEFREFSWQGFLKKYLGEVSMRQARPLTPNASPGERYRYRSGPSFSVSLEEAIAGARVAGGKLAGSADSKLAGSADSKLAGSADSKLAGSADSKLAGSADSKLAGSADSKLAGSVDSKLAGSADSKLAGSADSKLAGSVDSKLTGSADSKLAGSADSKLAGSVDSKLAGGGGSDLFFNSLKMFKNIESPWNISGFTKKGSE